MSWLFDLYRTQPIAHAIGVLAVVCVAGMALGSLKFRGIGLGTSGVLFAGILVGHFGEEIDHRALDFVSSLSDIRKLRVAWRRSATKIDSKSIQIFGSPLRFPSESQESPVTAD